ncbi:hypothetical protein [Ferrimonas futtsuensis]|uniref:M61 family metallopeptidase n=1 Tax=Ferrimonas futtsuensis TaxID=364764 RepID=UPI000480E447|nr:hypothetical protein [Ferrimonas futtsuensis]
MNWLKRLLVCLCLWAGPASAGCEGPPSFQFDQRIPDGERAKLRRWLGEAAQTVAELAGQHPVRCARIRVYDGGRGRGAVPWAQIDRGAAEGIRFYVDYRLPLHSLRSDWTAMHEFSHLLIPFPGNDQPWFSEGLASYLQYLLMARAGILSSDEAMKRLDRGFRRGVEDDDHGAIALEELSRDMWRRHAYRRVYWSGAAYFLAVDTELRRSGKGSLTQVLAQFVACCRQQSRHWTVDSLVQVFDRLSGTTLFADTKAALMPRTGFPDLSRPYEYLGLVQTGHGVRLKAGSPWRERRQRLVADVAIGRRRISTAGTKKGSCAPLASLFPWGLTEVGHLFVQVIGQLLQLDGTVGGLRRGVAGHAIKIAD